MPDQRRLKQFLEGKGKTRSTKKWCELQGY